jgi:hypothetical protein
MFSFEYKIPVDPGEIKINSSSENGQEKHAIGDYGIKHGGSFK